MFERDLSKLSPKQQEVYNRVFEDTEALFLAKTEKLSIIHAILIDRFVASYLRVIELDTETDATSLKKQGNCAQEMQRWTTAISNELHSASMEREERKKFYLVVKSAIEEVISDAKVRKAIFKRILEEVKK